MTAVEVIASLDLKPLAMEGGFYRETYRSTERFVGRATEKAVGTAIYYLLTPDTYSALHRLPTDEIFHFYAGDPVEMLQLREAGGQILVLGNHLASGQKPQVVVPAGVWFGSALAIGGAWALMGTTMAPGFDFTDYEAADRAEMTARYPEFADAIRRLTKPRVSDAS